MEVVTNNAVGDYIWALHNFGLITHDERRDAFYTLYTRVGPKSWWAAYEFGI